MAEREKRRATTFVTSRGAIINVAAPSVYIAPGVTPADVTNPTEMREALREELYNATSELVRIGSIPVARGSRYNLGADLLFKRVPLYRTDTVSIALGASGTVTLRPKEALIDLGSPGDPDSVEAGNPQVIKTADGYYMFYAGYDSFHYTICLATSSDCLTWTKRGRVLGVGGAGSWDEDHLLPGPIIQIGRLFYMLYSGNPFGPLGYRVGLATSTDLINWTKYAGNPIIVPTEPWQDEWVVPCSVIYDSGTYYLYVESGYGIPWSNRGVGRYRSVDFINWTLDPTTAIISSDSPAVTWREIVYFISVLKIGRTWYMWLRGSKATAPAEHYIGLFTSDDGINWTEHPASPVMRPGETGDLDVNAVGDHCVLRVGDTLLMFHGGRDATNVSRILVSQSRDGVVWNKGFIWAVKAWNLTLGANVTVNSIRIDGQNTGQTGNETNTTATYGDTLHCDDRFEVNGSNAGPGAQNLQVQLWGHMLLRG